MTQARRTWAIFRVQMLINLLNIEAILKRGNVLILGNGKIEIKNTLMNKELVDFFIRGTKDFVKKLRDDFERSLVYYMICKTKIYLND